MGAFYNTASRRHIIDIIVSGDSLDRAGGASHSYAGSLYSVGGAVALLDRSRGYLGPMQSAWNFDCLREHLIRQEPSYIVYYVRNNWGTDNVYAEHGTLQHKLPFRTMELGSEVIMVN